MKPQAIAIVALFAVLVCFLSTRYAAGTSSPAALPPVVSAEWLSENLEDQDLITLHIGSPDSYEEGHIPGARKASLRRLIRVNDAGIRDEMVSTGDFAEALAELGIGDHSRIVVYFSHEDIAWAAARYLLTLEHFGMSGRVAYLDGGLPGWTAGKRPVSTDVPSFGTTEFTGVAVSGVIVDTEWLQSRLEDPGIAIVDGRPAEGYSGLSGHWDRLGHIPGAHNIPFFTLLAEEPSYMLRSREELVEVFSEAGAKPGGIVVVYCGTGLWASLPYLAARHAGYDARLYDGSFQEWSATENLLVVKSANRDGSDE